MINFLKNIWSFRKELYAFKTWDYSFNLNLFAKSLELTAIGMESYSNEIDADKLQKINKIKRAVELIKRVHDDSYFEEAEDYCGIKFKYLNLSAEDTANNVKIFSKVSEIEKNEWDELWNIMKGQDLEKNREFDGSGIKSWWY